MHMAFSRLKDAKTYVETEFPGHVFKWDKARWKQVGGVQLYTHRTEWAFTQSWVDWIEGPVP